MAIAEAEEATGNQVPAAANGDTISEFAKEWFSIQSDRLKLRKRYFNKVQKAVGVRTATRFIQVENVIGMMIDLQIAAELPLVE